MRIQNEDIKSLAQLQAAGGQKKQLPSSDKIFIDYFGVAKTLGEAIGERLIHGQPLMLRQGYPPSSSLYLEPSISKTIEGTAKAHSPVKSQIFNIPLSSIDFQTGATSGVQFDFSIPTGVYGWFTRAGLTLLASGVIKIIFSPPDAVFQNLLNPGALFAKGGLPLGYLELEYTDDTKLKSMGAPDQVILNFSNGRNTITIFGSGSGGAGSGDANSILETLKNHFSDSLYDYLTPNIFSTEQETLIEYYSTAKYDVANENVKFSVIGDTLRTKDLVDNEFREEKKLITEIDAMVFWSKLGVDPLFTLEATRDNGYNWNPVDMKRVGNSEAFHGSLVFPAPVLLTTFAEFIVSGAPSNDLSFTDTLAKVSTRISGTYGPTDLKAVMKLKIHGIIKTGSPSGTILASLVKNSTVIPGTPGEVYDDFILSFPPIHIASLGATTDIELEIPLTALPLIDFGYHVVLETDDAYRASYNAINSKITLRNKVNGPAFSASKTVSGQWVSGINPFSFSLKGIDLVTQLRVVSGTENVYLDALALFYGRVPSQAVTSKPASQIFSFSGSEDRTVFEIGNFTVEPSLLRAYDVGNGLVYRNGVFSCQGQTILFSHGQFLSPSETITLIFEQQPEGGTAFDLSNENSQLLAANFLGSTDSGIDRSQPGRGIFLRRPDGVLVELTVDANNNIAIYTV